MEEEDMHSWNETAALLIQLESALNRLEKQNYNPPGSCCACLQDVDAEGHLPSCYLAEAIEGIAEWKRSSTPGGDHWSRKITNPVDHEHGQQHQDL
jgi:hypothetical protein